MTREQIIETMARGMALVNNDYDDDRILCVSPYLSDAAAALSALEAAGLVVVPVEPTPAMEDAVLAADLDIYWGYTLDGRPDSPKDVYTAMIKAAQEGKP